MQTLLLVGLGYLVLSSTSKPSSSTPATSSAPNPTTKTGATDLASAFGAFVGSLIGAATKDSQNNTSGGTSA